MAEPARPVQDAIIDPAWGQWVHDAVKVNTIPNAVRGVGVANGMLALEAQTVTVTTAAGGLSPNMPFYAPFSGTPVVYVCSGYDGAFATLAVQAVTATGFAFVARNVSGGTPLVGAAITVNYIVIGRRGVVPTSDVDRAELLPGPNDEAEHRDES